MKQEELTEQELLVVGTVHAMDSLSPYLLSGKRKGHICFLTSNLYSQADVAQSEFSPIFMNQEVQGHKLSKGLDAFVEEQTVNSECFGFVPLTDEVRKVLTDKHKLRPVYLWMKLAPENVSYDLYGIK